MLKKLLTIASLGLFVVGIACNVGCGGPGEPVKGTASNADFGKSGTKDKDGNEAPDGTAHID